jgi:hypothetical protein
MICLLNLLKSQNWKKENNVTAKLIEKGQQNDS